MLILMLFHVCFVLIFCSTCLLCARATRVMEEHDLDLGNLSSAFAN